jgi:hypothetical protein
MPTASQVDAILRDDYKSYWENLNQSTFLLGQIETKKDSVEGRIARHSIHTGRSGGIGARVEGATLPTADQQRHATVPVPVRWNTARIQLTVQLMAMATGEPGAFVNALESEMSIKNDVRRDMNRQVFGTSNGVMATCGTTTTSATIQLLSTTTAAQMRHFYVGRYVDIGTVASPFTVAQARQITAVDATNKTITVSGATLSTTSGTHFVFNSGSGGASDNSGSVNDGQAELTGMQTIMSTSAVLHTLNPSSQPIWKAQVYSNSGTNRPLAESMIDLGILNNQIESGETISALISNVGVFVSAKQILSAYQRNIDTLDFKGGFKGIKWDTPGVSGIGSGSIGWVTDFDCPANTVYGVNFDKLVAHQIGEGWQWMDDDGAILSRVANSLAYEAVLYTSLELACVQRNAHFAITDLTEAS